MQKALSLNSTSKVSSLTSTAFPSASKIKRRRFNFGKTSPYPSTRRFTKGADTTCTCRNPRMSLSNMVTSRLKSTTNNRKRKSGRENKRNKSTMSSRSMATTSIKAVMGKETRSIKDLMNLSMKEKSQKGRRVSAGI